MLVINTLISESRDSKILTVNNITGNYDATTNPTGLGTSQSPTNKRKIADIIGSYYNILKPKTSSTTVGYLVIANLLSYNSTISQALATNGSSSTAPMLLDTSSIGLDGGLPFPVGVYKFQYLVNFSQTDTAIFTAGSNLVTVVDTNLYLGATHIGFSGGSYIYEIASIVDETTIMINTKSLDDGIKTTMYILYGSDFYIGIKQILNTCLANKTANLQSEIHHKCSCNCTKNNCRANELMKMTLLYNAIDLNIQLAKYNEAQRNIDVINNFCTNKCDCGCGK